MTDMDLMLHHDGELAEGEARAVEERLAADPDARAKVEALGQVGEVVRTHVELAADEAEPALDALWSRIERGISANGAAEEAAVAVPVRRTKAQAEERGFFGAVAAWFDQHRGHFITGAVTAGAVAAVMLAMRPEPQVTERVVVRESGPQPAQLSTASVESTPPEVEYLEFNDGSGTVLSLPSAGDESGATVIWLTPDETNVEGPI
jgi:anti-sigma factor RsiW